jgi:hypothetical protein
MKIKFSALYLLQDTENSWSRRQELSLAFPTHGQYSIRNHGWQCVDSVENGPPARTISKLYLVPSSHIHHPYQVSHHDHDIER